MFYSLPLAAVALLLPSLVSAHDSVVLKNVTQLPAGWIHVPDTPVAEDETICLSIGVHDDKMSSLKKRGRHTAFRIPSEGASRAILDWLAENGVSDAKVDQAGSVKVNTTAKRVKRLFEANMAHYSYQDSAPVPRALSYSVPADLAEKIRYVSPLAEFEPEEEEEDEQREERLGRREVVPGDTCFRGGMSLMIPSCLRHIYTWPEDVSTYFSVAQPADSATPTVRLAIAGFRNNYVNHVDVRHFLKNFAKHIYEEEPSFNFTVGLVKGASNVPDDNVNIQNDGVQFMELGIALGYPANVTYYKTDSRGPMVDAEFGKDVAESDSDTIPHVDLLEHLLALPDSEVPHVLAVPFSNDEQTVPQEYAEEACELYKRLTERGTTVVVASGSSGARGSDDLDQDQLEPTFPASCPWVTSVGSTNNKRSDDVGTAASFSGGGFSNYFTRPDWQNEAVAGYLKSLEGTESGKDKAGLYDASGRGFPDLAVAGENMLGFAGKLPVKTTGSGASTVIVAAAVAIINDARLRDGNPPLGFLNPRLYSKAANLHKAKYLEDIVDGASQGYTMSNGTKVSGWPARPGWDAVTGLGAINSVFGLVGEFVS